MAGISPLRAAGKVSRERYAALADAVKAILAHAITRGGTTLRDFPQPGRRARLLRAGTDRVRARRRALPALRASAEAGIDRPARFGLVRALPALTPRGRHGLWL
jgi:hypothetical protein